MYYDHTNAFGPKKPCMASQQAASILKKNPSAVATTMAVFEVAEKMIVSYSKVLGQEGISKARALCWGRESVEDYVRVFMVNVLMSYRIWDVTDSKLESLREAIRKNNPEWLPRFDRDVESKRKQFKGK